MTQQNPPQRSTDSYLNLSLALNDGMAQDLFVFNNRLHLSDHKRSVFLQKPSHHQITSDLLSSDFYEKVNAADSTVWAFHHSASIFGRDDNIMLSGWFDLVIRCRDAVKTPESYFKLYHACSNALLNNRHMSEGVVVDWLIQPAEIEPEDEGEAYNGYVMRCCIESLEYDRHKTLVERMHAVTGLIADSSHC